MNESLNGDLMRYIAVDTAQMQWTASPSGTVWRKRVHRVGPQESGQVTSIVRYDANANFPQHDHPDGEEILVLEGVFSDEHGDWPAGTYLLNPEGFRHAPFSKDGCVLFVKLRQFPGTNRQHVVIDSEHLQWLATPTPGVEMKPLYEQAGFEDVVHLEHWSPDASLGVRFYNHGAELFVVEGSFSDERGSYGAGSWLRFPVNSAHEPKTAAGCTLYVKRGGLVYLDPQ